MTKATTIIEGRDLSVWGDLFPLDGPKRVAQRSDYAAHLRFTDPAAPWAIAAAEVVGHGAWYGRRPGHHHVFQIALEGEQFHHGCRLAPGRLVVYLPGSDMIIHTRSRCSWFVLGIDAALAAPVMAGLRDHPRRPRGAALTLTVAPGPWRAFADAARAAMAAVAGEPVGGPAPEPHRAALLQALRAAIGRAHAVAPTRSAQSVTKAEEVIGAAGTRRVRVQELADAAGVGERALRQAFIRVYGMGPADLLKARQLVLARMLLRGSLRRGSVSAVAARLGIFSFGRFAVEYRRLFGESPSQTLARGSRPV